MTQNAHLRNLTSIRLQYLITFFVILVDILRLMKRYEFICKRRNYHNPLNTDLDIFLANDSVTKDTICFDCGCAIRLIPDDENVDIYWIQEL